MASETPISPVGVSKPELTITAASINNEPVELDSTPTSPEKSRRRGSKAEALEQLAPEEQEKRAKIISDRQRDAAVLVDIPQTPGAEEFNKSEDAEGNVTKNTRAGGASAQ